MSELSPFDESIEEIAYRFLRLFERHAPLHVDEASKLVDEALSLYYRATNPPPIINDPTTRQDEPPWA